MFDLWHEFTCDLEQTYKLEVVDKPDFLSQSGDYRYKNKN